MLLGFWLQKLSVRLAAHVGRRRRSFAPPEVLEPRLLLTTFNVDVTTDGVDADPGDGVAETASGSTTLRAAVQEANALSGDDVIQIPAGTYFLLTAGAGTSSAATGDLDLTDNVTIQGAGASETFIDANDLDRIFDVAVNVTVVIRNLTLRNASTLSAGEHGGAVRNFGSLTIENCILDSNGSAGGGGGIANLPEATLMVKDTVLKQNVCGDSVGGAGLFNQGDAHVSGCVFDGNISAFHGGGAINIGNVAELTVTESTFRNNRVSSQREGGGLFNAAIATVRRSLFTENQATNGGAISNNGNGSADLLLENVTISDNVAGNHGGGLYNSNSSDDVGVVHCTIVLNATAINGGGIRNQGLMSMTGTIVANNTASQAHPDISGGVASAGYNLVQNMTGTGGFGANDISGSDPLLEALADYGGPTQTHRPMPGSPVIDAGDPADSLNDDQRTYARPLDANGDGDARHDIGAVEIQSLIYTSPGPGDITIILNGNDIEIIDNTTSQPIVTQPFEPAGQVSVTGSDSDDAITVDFSNGNPIPSGGFTVDGAASSSGGDTLTLTGTSFTAVSYGLLTAPDGEITLDSGTATSVLSFSNQEQILDLLGSANRSFSLRSTGETVTLSDDGDTGNGITLLSVDASAEQIAFVAPTSSLTLVGADGNDQITATGLDPAFAGSLQIRGENGNDTINASALSLAVSLYGGAADDNLTGGSAADFILGDAGNDTAFGGNGNDTLLGSSQMDSLSGGPGNDMVLGQGGSKDTVSGGEGNDTLNGGGNDMLFEEGNSSFVLTDSQLTGLGTDVLVGIVAATLAGGAANDTIDISSFSGYVAVFGRAGNDTIIGNGAPNYMQGDDGDDLLQGFGGNDTLIGSAGKDTLTGSDGNDWLRGLGSSGDELTGGAGEDTLDGGAGTDRVIEAADANFIVTATQMTGVGTDRLIGVEEVRITAGAGNNSINAVSFPGRIVAFGLDGNDTIIGAAGADLISGGIGNDVLKGRNGNDLLFGDAGNDTLHGGIGDDVLDGGTGIDGLSGWDGNDSLLGGASGDTMYGGNGNDTLRGSDGNDTIQGGADNDSLDGEGGTDKLTGGTGNGTADPGDAVVGSLGEIDESFNLNPLPAWVNDV